MVINGWHTCTELLSDPEGNPGDLRAYLRPGNGSFPDVIVRGDKAKQVVVGKSYYVLISDESQ